MGRQIPGPIKGYRAQSLSTMIGINKDRSRNVIKTCQFQHFRDKCVETILIKGDRARIYAFWVYWYELWTQLIKHNYDWSKRQKRKTCQYQHFWDKCEETIPIKGNCWARPDLEFHWYEQWT